MVVENLGCERNSFLRRDGSVCKNLKGELVVIGIAADTGILDAVADIIYRCVYRIGIDNAYRRLIVEFVLFLRNISASVIEGQLHIEARVFAYSRDMKVGVKDFKICILLDVSCRSLAGTCYVEDNSLRPV